MTTNWSTADYSEYMVQEMKEIQFFEGFPDMEQWAGDRKRLGVIVDLRSKTDDSVSSCSLKAVFAEI